MFSDQIFIAINIGSIVFLLIIMIVATRMKGGAGWAALVIVATTVPVYLANMTRDLGSDYFLICLYPCTLLNAISVPSLWFFIKSQLDKSFRLKVRHLIHAIPAIVSFLITIIYYAPLSSEQVEAERAFIEAGGENLPALISDVIMFGQLVIYASILFIYVYRRKRSFRDNYSDSDYSTSPIMDAAQMKDICDKVVDYLLTTKAYLDSDLSLTMLSGEVKIHHKNISTAINGYLHKNFFELINGMRITEAKRLLVELSRSNYTVESIYAECGFRSRSTFFMAFKKIEGTSPAKWLLEISPDFLHTD